MCLASISVSQHGHGGPLGPAAVMSRKLDDAKGQSFQKQLTAKLSRLCKGGEVLRAWETLHAIQADAAEANVIHYNTLISGCGRVSNWQLSLQLLFDLEDQSMPTDVRSYVSD